MFSFLKWHCHVDPRIRKWCVNVVYRVCYLSAWERQLVKIWLSILLVLSKLSEYKLRFSPSVRLMKRVSLVVWQLFLLNYIIKPPPRKTQACSRKTVKGTDWWLQITQSIFPAEQSPLKLLGELMEKRWWKRNLEPCGKIKWVKSSWDLQILELQIFCKLAGKSQIKIARSPLLPYDHKKERNKVLNIIKSVPISLKVQVGMDKHFACYKQEKSKKPYPPAVKRLTLIQDCADECSSIACTPKSNNTLILAKAEHIFV